MVCPPAIQLSPLFRAQRQLCLAIIVREALPQRHRQVGPIAGREPQQLCKRARFHGVILSCSIRCGKRVYRDGWLKEADLAGLQPRKIADIKRGAGMFR
jgi:hypothetical protein